MPTTSRNIVLLSDGTGNSAAKLMKTNVWRMYEAIDLSTGDQLALYDNGVGTSSFRPLQMLGGAIGLGLKRNVLRLYRFACHNYKTGGSPETSDVIFAFGFSRGAFTIRVLIGLIESQGLIPGLQGRELERQAKWAYRAYRREFNPTGGLVGPLRNLRDVLLRLLERGKRRYTNAHNVRPRMAFVGLWDTVDAYGLPIDEMTRGWDQWIWPLSISDHKRPPVAAKICHAVSLDDERHTFHPVLFDESEEPSCRNVSEEKVTQVWFSGVHSNVGGGYPDDSVSYVPLRWMAEQAKNATPALRLHPHMEHEWQARSGPNGPVYDSRRGLGSYYRYNPRSIQKLTKDRFAEVSVPLPKIHESVFQRIARGRDAYAPIVLPERYAVVDKQGNLLSGPANPFEHPTQSASRCADQERVWNRVWKRRIAYFSTVLLTFVLVVAPLFVNAGGNRVLSGRSRAVSAVIETAGQFVPGFAQAWVRYYRDYPFQLVVGGGLVLLLLFISTRLQRSIRDNMRRIWDDVVNNPRQAVRPSENPTDWIYRLRSHPAYRMFFEIVTQKVFPFVFGFSTLLALILIVAGTVNRGIFAAVGATGRICPNAEVVAWDGSPVTRLLPSNQLCQSTGLFVKEGQRYRVSIALPPDWADSTIPVQEAAGFSSLKKPQVFIPFLPFRRVLMAQWFVPIVRLGSHGAEYHPLEKGDDEFTPRRSTQLFMFVNDAIGPVPFFKTFYSNNHGTATVTIYSCEKGRCDRPVEPR